MRFPAMIGALAGLALAAGRFAPGAAAAPPAAADLVRPALYAESATVAPGRTLWLDVHLAIAPGWHVYWRNPGDSGLPTTLRWTLPPGFAAGDIAWPVPERFVLGSIANYGYAGGADLLVPIAVPAGLDGAAPAHLAAALDYLACAEICIPSSATLATDLPVGDGAPDPRQAARFAAARRLVPEPAPFAARFSVADDALRLDLPETALAGIDRPDLVFFPDRDDVIDHSAAQRVERHGDRIALVLAKSSSPAAAVPAELDGVLAVRGADGLVRGYVIAAPPAAPPAQDAAPASAAWWQALLFAFVGGMILNLMPCVFPILSLKLLSFAGAEPARRHHHGIAYAAGVLASFVGLGGTLVALRAGGAAIGWGFQLQSPPVVGLLAYLMLAMGLSLSGVAEFGAGLVGVGG
ncbi:MAG TPA: protein-disulfide reductase DsbD domain-containing protein, partial [Stellaceae bacterium]|nr:protein-disulfide reductase DsbD domain-containing protein [Stellaceae bacterium]